MTAGTVRCVHVVVPDTIDDPARPSGGNIYDRRICRELTVLGWTVRMHPVAGRWPRPDAAARVALAAVLAEIPRGAAVLIDGLIGSTGVPDSEQRRLRSIILVHMPLGSAGPAGAEPLHDDRDEGNDGAGGTIEPDNTGKCDNSVECAERAALTGAAAVVTTSEWTKDAVMRSYGLSAHRVHVVRPGVDIARPAAPPPDESDAVRHEVVRPDAAWPDAESVAPNGGNLLVVGAVTPVKGHDLLVAALAEVADLPWRCVCVGALDLDPAYADRVRAAARDAGIAGRVRFAGVRSTGELDGDYGAADVLVVCSRYETYGMAVTEALARGIPVIAAAVGGVHEALAGTAEAELPGVLIPPEDPHLLAAELRAWLGDGGRRSMLRRAAARRGRALDGWPVAGRRMSEILTGVLA